MKYLSIIFLFLIYWGCESNIKKKFIHENWKVESQLTKRINNVNFNFPENYSVKQFEELWKTGLNNFQNIYGEKFLSIIDEMENQLKSNYLDVIELDFDLFMEGCT